MQEATICQPQPTSWALCMRNQKLVCLLTAIFSFFFSSFFFSNHLLNTWRTGNPLLPVSYQEMEDEVTGKKEKRKVAKPEGI